MCLRNGGAGSCKRTDMRLTPRYLSAQLACAGAETPFARLWLAYASPADTYDAISDSVRTKDTSSQQDRGVK